MCPSDETQLATSDRVSLMSPRHMVTNSALHVSPPESNAVTQEGRSPTRVTACADIADPHKNHTFHHAADRWLARYALPSDVLLAFCGMHSFVGSALPLHTSLGHTCTHLGTVLDGVCGLAARQSLCSSQYAKCCQ